MTIAGEEIREIIVADHNGHLVASITDDDLIEEDHYVVKVYGYDDNEIPIADVVDKKISI